MNTKQTFQLVFILACVLTVSNAVNLPVVINTWPFVDATKAAWEALNAGHSIEDSLVIGCSMCETLQCDGSVGYGSNPDETGETTLDAMVMDGSTHDVGAVGDLRRVKNAVGVARAVMRYTSHTLLVGESATKFAVEMGFKEETLSTNKSRNMYKQWQKESCQPNYRLNVTPNPKSSCGPYSPIKDVCHSPDSNPEGRCEGRQAHPAVNQDNHDTIGMVVIDTKGNVFAGTSTNGMNHKVPGRVGDSPIMGAGAYASNDGGGAVETGDGDVMMRFLPRSVGDANIPLAIGHMTFSWSPAGLLYFDYRAVLEMERGASPEEAAKISMLPIIKHYPTFSGALVAVNLTGHYGAYCHGFSWFKMSVANPEIGGVKVINVPCQ